MRILVFAALMLFMAACGDDQIEQVEPVELNTTGELSAAADTAEEAFEEAGEVGVIAVQGGPLPGDSLFVATGNLEMEGALGSPGAVTIREGQGGTVVLLTLDAYPVGGELQATFVRGACGEDGDVVSVIEPVITVPPTGITEYEGRSGLEPLGLFDGEHSLKIVPAPASEGRQEAGVVLGCARLPQVDRR